MLHHLKPLVTCSTVLTCRRPQHSNNTRVNDGTIPLPPPILTSNVLSISAVWTGPRTLSALLSFQRASLTDVLNCFGAFLLICFVWVCVCLYWWFQEQKGRMGCRRRQRHYDKVRALLHLCELIKWGTHSHTHTHSDDHSKASKTDKTTLRYLPVALSTATTPYSFYFISPEQGSVGLQQGEGISKCLQEIKRMLYSDESFGSKTRFPSTEKMGIIQITDINSRK